MIIEQNNNLELINRNGVLHLCDKLGSILAKHNPFGRRFEQFKRVGKDCNIIREDDEGFPESKANIYCLDDNFNLVWTIAMPFKNDSFPNSIVWNKSTIRRKKEDRYLTLEVIENIETFICSSRKGVTLTVNYLSGKTINEEFTK